MSRVLTLTLATLILAGVTNAWTICAPADNLARAGADEPAGVLIANGKGHHHGAKPEQAMRDALKLDRRMQPELVDIASLAETDLSPYATLVISDAYSSELLGQPEFDHIERFVRDGGGLVLIHFACGAFRNLAEQFEPMAGRVWFGRKPPPGRRQHDPYGEFTVKITGVEHPITAGLSDFQTTDELYTCFADSEVPITVLAESTSKIDGKNYPMAFVLNYHKGRVFHCTLGHDRRAITSDGPGGLIRRGTAWTAGLELTR